MNRPTAALRTDPGHLRVQVQPHPVGLERGRHRVAGRSNRTGQHTPGHLEEVHLDTEPGHSLSEFATHGAGAENRQAPGAVDQVEERVVGERIALLQSRNPR